MPENLELLLSSLKADQKTFSDKAAEEQKRFGTMLEETKTNLTKIQTQVDSIDVKLAQKHIAEQGHGSTLIKTFEEDENLKRLLRDRKGHAVIKIKGADVADLMERKSIISAVTTGTANGDPLAPVGVATTGVLPIDRIPGIVAEARQVLKVRNLFTQRPTTMQVIDYVRVNTPMSIASPVPEASVKPENQLTFSSLSERVKLLATWIPATRQVLDDFAELMSFIQSSLPFYVNLEEELQILLGDNVGEDLHGIVPQASTYNAAYMPLSAAQGWNKMDQIAAAISQIMAAKEIPPTFLVINPVDWWGIRLTKDGFGRYIINPDPSSMGSFNLFGLDVVATTSMPIGQFLVGSGNPVAAEIRDRAEMTVEVSTEHADYFVRNLVAIRAEKRLAFICKRPNSFVSGTFLTSPVTPA